MRSPKLQADRYAGQLRRESLHVVILGPGQAQPRDLNKRKQIASRLRDHGYVLAKLGEDFLGNPDEPLHFALHSKLPEIDLLLVLNTGVAPLVELTAISIDYRATEITKVWSKREYTEGPRSTPSDVLDMFDNWAFNQDEFDSCELVESIVATAEEFCQEKAKREGDIVGWGLLPPPS